MPLRIDSRRSRAIPARVGGAAMLLLALGGCQTYEPVALDIGEYRQTWNARAGGSEALSDYAKRLAEHDQLVPETFDLSDGMARAEGEVMALFYNPELRLARLEAGVTKATADNTGLWQDPEFGFDGAEILSPSAPFEYGLTLSLTIPVSGRLGVEQDRADAAYEAELRRVVDAEWNVRARVRAAWTRWSAASEELDLLRNAFEQVQRIETITDRLEQSGELTRVEARLLRAELIELRARQIEAENNAAMAKIELLGLLGLPPHAEIELRPELASPAPQSIDVDESRLIEQNTQLAVKRAAYLVAEESLRLEIRKQYPDITIGGGYGSEDNDDRLLLGVAVPIPILNANRAGIAEARARRDNARAEAETTYETISHALATAQARLNAVRTQRLAYENELVPMLDRQSDEVEQLADLGEIDTLLLLETVNRRLDTQSQLLRMIVTEHESAIEIARLLGPDQVEGERP